MGKNHKKLIVFFTAILLITLACSFSGSDEIGAITVEISSPVEGATVVVGQEVFVVASVIADDGVQKAYLSINGQIIATEEPGVLPQAHVTNFSWVPVAEGSVKLSVTATDGQGESTDPASVNLTVVAASDGSSGDGGDPGSEDPGGEDPTEEPSADPPTETPEPDVPTNTPVPPTNTPPPTPTFTYTPHPPTPTLTPTATPVVFAITVPPIILTILPQVEKVSAQVNVPAGGTASKSVQCPAETTVVGGGFAVSSSVYIYNHHLDNNGWKAFGSNLGPSDKTMTVYAQCIRYLAGSSSQTVPKQISVPAGGDGHVVVSCPGGTTVVSGGFVSNHKGNVHIRNSSKTDNGWQVYVTNSGTSSELVNVHATCLSSDASISTTMVLEQDTVDSGNTAGLFTACPSGWVTGGGFAGGEDMRFYNSSPRDNDEWVGYVRNNTGASKLFNVYAVCLTLD